MATDKGLTGSERVRKLQTMLHAKAKEDSKRRFHALCDKVWREDLLQEAWEQVRRNGGSAGGGRGGFKDIEAYGVGRWLGELARDLREGTYVPKPVRQVLIPKKQPGKYRPLGIPCIRDRVAQTAAPAGVGADLRSGPGTGAVWLSTGAERTRRGQTCAWTPGKGLPGGG